MKSLRTALFLAAVFAFFAMNPRIPAADILLYDASSATLPGDQPWLFYAGLGSATQTLLGSTGTRLVTDLPAQAGWSNTVPISNAFKNPAFPVLNAAEGYAIDWSMRMISENHTSDNRAGTSMILLGSNNFGIELGFWTDHVWAQKSDPLFTRGETVNFDTATAYVNYRLLVSGSNYELFANQARILSGQTRSYAAFGSAPYTLSNYVFLGDNTTSAGATVEIGSIRLTTTVPETGMTSLIIALTTGVLAIRRRWSRSPVSIV